MTISPSSKRRNESITFRLDKDIITELRREAEQNKVSLNTVVNQGLDFFVKFASSAKADIIPIPKATIVELVEGYSEDELKSIAERVFKRVSTDVAFQFRGRYDFEAIVDIYEYHLKASGVPYKHMIDEHNKKRHTFIVQYNMGRKWSLFAAEASKVGFEPVLAKNLNTLSLITW